MERRSDGMMGRLTVLLLLGQTDVSAPMIGGVDAADCNRGHEELCRVTGDGLSERNWSALVKNDA